MHVYNTIRYFYIFNSIIYLDTRAILGNESCSVFIHETYTSTIKCVHII